MKIEIREHKVPHGQYASMRALYQSSKVASGYYTTSLKKHANKDGSIGNTYLVIDATDFRQHLNFNAIFNIEKTASLSLYL
jgi:hypothetical protein